MKVQAFIICNPGCKSVIMMSQLAIFTPLPPCSAFICFPRHCNNTPLCNLLQTQGWFWESSSFWSMILKDHGKTAIPFDPKHQLRLSSAIVSRGQRSGFTMHCRPPCNLLSARDNTQHMSGSIHFCSAGLDPTPHTN